MAAYERLRTDILILGSGGAGLFAALHARRAEPDLSITIAVKGLIGKTGCTRMVQGGYNVAIAEGDSLERHFMDTIVGGAWLSRQDLAWRLVTGAHERIIELENEIGCFFDRNPDGTMHQKAFAGQSFDRTVHKGDLTGIEIINRLMEQALAANIGRFEDHRAIALIKTAAGDALAGVLMIDMRSGEFVLVEAKAVLLATGGGPTMYRYHTPSGDKSCDGLAMALRAGLDLRDMEMVQFHPTGLLAGSETRMTGTVLEEGLRGAGGRLLGGDGKRFMEKYSPAAERATRDVVSRAIYQEMRQGNTTPAGGVYIDMSHLGADQVRAEFKGMVERCADCGFDLAGGRVEVVPTAHYLMGGVIFEPDGSTGLPGLFAAGILAGDTMASWAAREGGFGTADEAAIDEAIGRARRPFSKPAGDINRLRQRLYDLMWEDVGIIRDRNRLQRAIVALDELADALDMTGLGGQAPAFNLTWQDWLNLESLITVGKAIAATALARAESRGAHFREDFPDTGDHADARYAVTRMRGKSLDIAMEAVDFSIVKPGESLIEDDAGAPPASRSGTEGRPERDGSS
jgi:fumarate reductase flavoprotein subunit